MKACPQPVVLRALAARGCGFDVASPDELVTALAAGARAECISYGHPIAARAARATAVALGVHEHVVDSTAELRKLADVDPHARVSVRLAVEQGGADWPLADKYGVGVRETVELLRLAQDVGLTAAGVTFHVGSQQRDARRWRDALTRVALVVEQAQAVGVDVRQVNLGGGWPAQVAAGDPSIEEAAGVALEAAHQLLPADVRLLAEPGRALVAAAGVIVSTVLGVADRPDGRWVYLDTGLYGGLLEADGGGTRYPLATTAPGEPLPTVLAGPTCDSTDVFYRDARPLLPAGLTEGDRVLFGGAGAYTATYSTVGFNGHRPLVVECTDLGEHVAELPVVRDDLAVMDAADG